MTAKQTYVIQLPDNKEGKITLTLQTDDVATHDFLIHVNEIEVRALAFFHFSNLMSAVRRLCGAAFREAPCD